MTPRQLQALDFIRERITRGGFAPTYQEIADHLGCQKGRAHDAVSDLIAAGKLRRRTNRARGLELACAPDLRVVGTEQLRAELARRGDVPGALARPQRRAFGRRVACSADGCDVAVRYGHAFCLDHWRAISPATQQLLLGTHREACETGSQEAAIRYQDAFTRARDEAVLVRRAS